MAVVITVQGPSGSGKTTLIERLIPRLVARGLKIGVIKHTHHGLTVDPQGKDSWRIWQAGAQAVLLAAPQEILLRQRSSEPSFGSALALMPGDLDCIFVEGFAGDTTAPQANVQLRLAVSHEGVWLNGRQRSRDDLAAVEEAIIELMKGSTGADLIRVMQG